MKIENSDALNDWLVDHLGPICPGSLNLVDLAKYIVTLMKSKKPEDELQKFCLSKLDIFIPGDAESFVNTLFEVVKNRSYLTFNDAERLLAYGGGTKPAKTWSQTKGEKRKSLQVSRESTLKENQVPKSTLKSVIGNSTAIIERLGNGNSESNVRGLSEEPMDEKDFRKHVKQEKHDWHSLEEKDTSVSKRMRNDSESEKKSSRSKTKSQSERFRDGSKGESWPSHSKGSHSTSSQPELDHGDSSSGLQAAASPSESIKTQIDDSEVDGQSDDYDDNEIWPTRSRSLYNTVLQYSDDHGDSYGSQISASSSMDKKRDGKKGRTEVKKRCEDFEERGFCVLGDQCSFDHGTDPVVYAATPSNNFLSATYPPAVALQQEGIVSSTQPLPPYVPALYPSGNFVSNAPEVFPKKQDYNGQNRFWTSSKLQPSFPTCLSLQNRSVVINSEVINVPAYDPTRPPPPIHTYPKAQRPRTRELINVPTIDHVDSTSPTRNESSKSPNLSQVQSSHKRKKIMLRPKNSVPSLDSGLVLKLTGVPKHLNYVEHLAKHFAKFGAVTNIVTRADGDLQAAVIHYMTNSEAEAAYRYKGDILNCSSINVSWYKKVSVKPVRLPPPQPSSTEISHNKVPSSEMKPVKIERLPPKIPHKKIEFESTPKIRRNNYSLILSSSKHRKEPQPAMGTKFDLQKTKCNILQYQHYAKTQKLLMEQLKTCTNDGQRTYVKEAIKKFMKKMELLYAEITNESVVPKNNESVEIKTEISKPPNDGEMKPVVEEDPGPSVTEEIKIKQELLIGYEDDEDSDNEDRSWRR